MDKGGGSLKKVAELPFQTAVHVFKCSRTAQKEWQRLKRFLLSVNTISYNSGPGVCSYYETSMTSTGISLRVGQL
jgi:hypothetical protein